MLPVVLLSLGVTDIVDTLLSHGFAFADSTSTWPLLSARGAREVDMSLLPHLLDESIPQVDENGADVYPDKGTLCTYYAMDASVGDSNVTRSTCEHATRFEGSSIEYIESTTINANQSSYFRVHRAWPADAESSSLIVAAQRLVLAVMRELIRTKRRQSDHSILGLRSTVSLLAPELADRAVDEIRDDELENNILFEAMMTGFRVTRDQTKMGDPGPEGVHQDAALLTVVMLLQRSNVASESGGNRVWSLDQPFGKPAAADTEPTAGRLLGSRVLRQPFDALFVLDREVKHEALPILQADEADGPAVRDVLTFEVRRHCMSHA